MFECGGKGIEGFLFCGIRNEEIGIKFVVVVVQEFSSSGDRVLQGDVVYLGTVQCFFVGELVVSFIVDVSVLEIVGERERGFMNLDAIVQKNVFEGGESIKERLENFFISIVGVFDVRVTSKFVDKVSVVNCVFVIGFLDGNKLVEFFFVFSNGEIFIEKIVEIEVLRSCEESVDDLVGQNLLVILVVVKDKIFDGF